MPATPRISAVERERLERMAQAQRAQLAVSQPPRSSNPAAAALQSPAAARMRHGAASISDSPLPPSPPPLRVVPSPRRPAVNGRLSNAANAAALLDGDNITDPIQFAMRAYQAGAVMPAAAAAAAPSVVVPKQKIAVASVAVGAPAPVAAGNQSSQSYFLAACAALVIAAIVASFLGTNSSGSLSAHSHTGAANSASSTTAAAHLRMTMAEFAARQTEWQTQLDAAASAAESALTAVPEFASCAQPVSAASSPSAAAAAASSEQEDEIQMCPPLSALNAELTWSNWLQRKSAEQASASAASAPSSTDSPTVELQASSTKPAVDALEAARTALQLAEQVRASMTAAQTDMSAAETKVKARARQTMRVASLRVDFYRYASFVDSAF